MRVLTVNPDGDDAGRRCHVRMRRTLQMFAQATRLPGQQRLGRNPLCLRVSAEKPQVLLGHWHGKRRHGGSVSALGETSKFAVEATASHAVLTEVRAMPAGRRNFRDVAKTPSAAEPSEFTSSPPGPRDRARVWGSAFRRASAKWPSRRNGFRAGCSARPKAWSCRP